MLTCDTCARSIGEMERMSELKDLTANPAPLGLMGFAMTTILLNLHNAGIIALSSMILAMGIFYGGIAQVIAGVMEWKKGNTFGTTAFTSYGLFWLSLVALLILPQMGIGTVTAAEDMAWYLGAWGMFTFIMFFGTLRTNRALQFVFFSLALLFFGLAVADATGDADIKILAGGVGLICGISAAYTGLAQVLNESLGKVVMPLFPVYKRTETTSSLAVSEGK